MLPGMDTKRGFKTAAAFTITAILLHFANFLNSDEGFVLNGAWKMYQGQRIYEDFFSFIPPGSYLWTKWSFDLLGSSYWSAKLFSLLLLLASVWAIYRISAEFTRRRDISLMIAWSWLILSFYGPSLIINHNTHSSYVLLVGLYATILAVKRRKASLFFVGGFLLGLVTFFLQTKGILVSTALLGLFLLYAFRKEIAWKEYGAFALGIFTLPLIMIAVWGGGTLYEHLIQWPSLHYPSVNRVSSIPFLFAFVIFGVLLALALKKEFPRKILWIIAVSQIAAFLSALTRPDIFHIFWNSFGIIVLLFPLGADWLVTLRQRNIISVWLFRSRDFYKITILFLILPAVLLNAAMFFRHRAIVERLGAYQMGEFYSHPFMPGLYFELQSSDPYPYAALLTGMFPEEAFMVNLRTLDFSKPQFVLLQKGIVEKFDYNWDNILDRYIQEHYREIDRVGTIKILRRTLPSNDYQ